MKINIIGFICRYLTIQQVDRIGVHWRRILSWISVGLVCGLYSCSFISHVRHHDVITLTDRIQHAQLDRCLSGRIGLLPIAFIQDNSIHDNQRYSLKQDEIQHLFKTQFYKEWTKVFHSDLLIGMAVESGVLTQDTLYECYQTHQLNCLIMPLYAYLETQLHEDSEYRYDMNTGMPGVTTQKNQTITGSLALQIWDTQQASLIWTGRASCIIASGFFNDPIHLGIKSNVQALVHAILRDISSTELKRQIISRGE